MKPFFVLVLTGCATLVAMGGTTSMAKPTSFAVETKTLTFAADKLVPPRSIETQIWYPAVGEKIAPGRFPVLLYFPGWGGKVTDHATLLASLAARGFIVAGLSYPEGKGLPDPAVPMQFATDAAYAAGTAQGNRMVALQAEDASFVLDRLTRLDQSDPGQRFTGHIDVTRAGVLGYSLGGSVAAETALHDPRFLAVMNLDGWMFGDVATQMFTQPYLVISDDLTPPTAAELASTEGFLRNFSRLRQSDKKQQTAQLVRSGGYRITITGASHFTFTDHAQANQNMAGPIDPKRAMTILIAAAEDFFATHLQSQPPTLLNQPSLPFPEAKLENFHTF